MYRSNNTNGNQLILLNFWTDLHIYIIYNRKYTKREIYYVIELDLLIRFIISNVFIYYKHFIKFIWNIEFLDAEMVFVF